MKEKKLVKQTSLITSNRLIRKEFYVSSISYKIKRIVEERSELEMNSLIRGQVKSFP